jgi:hypothetical protein
VADWWFLGALAGGASFLVARSWFRRGDQDRAAAAAGLRPADDLSHLPTALQRTALWHLSDGGFERRVARGTLSRGSSDVEVTAFDLETLRDRRGEWAWLPVEPPFRIGKIVSVVVCVVDRVFPHVLFKRTGTGDELRDDSLLDRRLPLHPGDSRLPKQMRDVLGLPRSHAAEMPDALPPAPIDVELPANWRAYTAASERVAELRDAGFGTALEAASRRDLVVELLDSMIVVYPAAREVVGPDAFADLTTTALTIVDGVLASSPPLTPRGIETQRS